MDLPLYSPAPTTPFSGSFLPSDVSLLLDIVPAECVTHIAPAQKEALIQSGARHYADMLTLESAPSAEHMRLYRTALANGCERMAQAIADLAASLHAQFGETVTPHAPLVLVSLVRAGLPVGVLLQRALTDTHHPTALPSVHYGVSIIRERGLDGAALAHIVATHPDSALVFVDGWTGKGAIFTELQTSLQALLPALPAKAYEQIYHHGHGVLPLLTLADPAGVAWLAASDDDWLMPASLLNATVSGLISRTLYPAKATDFHQAVYYSKLQPYDQSLALVEMIDAQRHGLVGKAITPTPSPRWRAQTVIDALAARFGISNRNRIKPTIAEATRALLRRDPACVLIHPDAPAEDVALIRLLCQQKNVPIVTDAQIAPYQAVTLIAQRNSAFILHV